jgi:hypothetical protein
MVFHHGFIFWLALMGVMKHREPWLIPVRSFDPWRYIDIPNWIGRIASGKSSVLCDVKSEHHLPAKENQTVLDYHRLI